MLKLNFQMVPASHVAPLSTANPCPYGNDNRCATSFRRYVFYWVFFVHFATPSLSFFLLLFFSSPSFWIRNFEMSALISKLENYSFLTSHLLDWLSLNSPESKLRASWKPIQSSSFLALHVPSLIFRRRNTLAEWLATCTSREPPALISPTFSPNKRGSSFLRPSLSRDLGRIVPIRLPVNLRACIIVCRVQQRSRDLK